MAPSSFRHRACQLSACHEEAPSCPSAVHSLRSTRCPHRPPPPPPRSRPFLRRHSSSGPRKCHNTPRRHLCRGFACRVAWGGHRVASVHLGGGGNQRRAPRQMAGGSGRRKRRGRCLPARFASRREATCFCVLVHPLCKMGSLYASSIRACFLQLNYRGGHILHLSPRLSTL